jgi:hypothetical protein
MMIMKTVLNWYKLWFIVVECVEDPRFFQTPTNWSFPDCCDLNNDGDIS